MFLGSFSSVDPGEFAGLTQQAGAQWWSASGSTWTVGIDDAASQKVASYWQGLIAGGGVDNQPQWTAAWNKGMNDGKYIAWVSDIWAPGDFPTAAPSGAGKWMMTELPQWTAGAHVVGNWGGSSTAVMAASKNQQAAAQFIAWLNTDPAATAALVVRRRHLPGGQRRGGRADHGAVVLLQPVQLLGARQAVRVRGRERHLGPGRERRLQRVHRPRSAAPPRARGRSSPR